MSSLSDTLLSIQRQLVQYGDSANSIFGISGSFLNMSLLTRRQYRSVSCCIYFIMISILLLLILPLGIGSLLYSLNYPDPNATNTIFCKIRGYGLQVTLMMYRWCLVATCFDRYALTSDNARLRGFTQLRVAYCAIGALVILWLMIPAHILAFFYADGVRCYAFGSTAEALYHSLYTIVAGSLLPVASMTICAVLIRRNLLGKYEPRRQLVSNIQNRRVHQEHKHIQQIFPVLLLQVLLYVTTQTPWMIWNMYITSTIYVTNKSGDRLSIERFFAFLAEFIVYLLLISPFYLYTLLSRAYLDELIKLLHRSLSSLDYTERSNKNRVHPLLLRT